MTDCENVIQEQVRGLGDWVLVPRVPTDAMLRAAQSAWLNDPQRRTTTMWRAMLAAAQQPAGDGCHCGTCTCNPNMTPAVRFDLSPAQQEGAIREHLIRLGWTPPNEHALSQPAADQFIATFRCEDNGIVGVTDAKIHSVTRHDDGVIEVVIDHWPKQPAVHPAITHCDNCGCDWLDNGLNPVGCPYCKQNAWRAAFVAERATRYREGGMAVEQARIHAETEAAYLHARADLLRDQEEGREQ